MAIPAAAILVLAIALVVMVANIGSRPLTVNQSDMIVRHVTVDRDQTPETLINKTNRVQDIDKDVIKTIPHQGKGIEKVDLYFFKLNRYLTSDQIDQALAMAGLEADYYAQIQMNIDEPEFDNDHLNAAQWDNKDGKTSIIYFGWDEHNGSIVGCKRHDQGVSIRPMWIGGRRIRK